MSAVSFIITQRTWPRVATWVDLLGKLRNQGYLFTTGFGYGNYDLEITGAGIIPGSSMDQSPLPLYFRPESIGLREVPKTPSDFYLYQKVSDTDGKWVERVLRQGAVIDRTFSWDNTTDIIDTEQRDTQGNLVSIVPRDRDAIPVLWDGKQLDGFFDQVHQMITQIEEPNNSGYVWANITRRVSELRDELGTEYYQWRLKELGYYYRLAGYISDGEDLEILVRNYLDQVIEVGRVKSA